MLRLFIGQARKRQKQRPASPGVVIEQAPDRYSLKSPHRDLDAWEVQTCVAFGTRSDLTFSTFLDQLTRDLVQVAFSSANASGLVSVNATSARPSAPPTSLGTR